MLGFSLPKLIVLALIIAAVWYGFKMVSRRNTLRANKAAREAEDARKTAVEDTTECPVCKTFLPTAGLRSCGRPNCPYPH
jgi:hypothetical protein